MDYKFLKVDIEDNIATVEMNRKHELNALSTEMVKELDHVFSFFLKEEVNVKLIVLTGGEECFSSGIDLKEVPGMTSEEVGRYFRYSLALYTKLIDYDKMLITAVSGIAFGGGLNLALMGDMVIASESAIFAHPEIRFGFNPLLTPLINRVGIAKSKELALVAEPVGAHEALSIGLVNRVVQPEKFREEMRAWAARLSSRPAIAVRAMKRSFDVVSRLDAKAAIEYELEMTAILLNTNEKTRDGMRSLIKSKKNDRTC